MCAERPPPLFDLPSFRIRRISEAEIEQVVTRAGGHRAHLDADRRSKRGADFELGESVIELKILEDEGLDKPERQRKLAHLFRARFPKRPTIVLDRENLDEQGKRSYDRIFEGPVKTAVSSSRQQLVQSREELGATSTVLWVINNGYTSLSHEALMRLVARRARNDSRDIDTVIVSGAYSYSDAFDSFFLWPMELVPINIDKPFASYDRLHEAWQSFVMDRMNALIREPEAAHGAKGPVVDLSFQHDGVTYVFPAPPMGRPSNFFVHGRPRSNSTGIAGIPPVAKVFAGLTRHEWNRFKLKAPLGIGDTYEAWVAKESEARAGSALPFIVMPVGYEAWRRWAEEVRVDVSIHRYATTLFRERILQILAGAKELLDGAVLPRRYMLLITEEIGQDIAFDVSHLAEVFIRPDGEDTYTEVWMDRAIFFDHALALAAAEALSRGIDHVYWRKDLRYAWR